MRFLWVWGDIILLAVAFINNCRLLIFICFFAVWFNFFMMSEPNLAVAAQDRPGAGPGRVCSAPGGPPRGREDGASERFRCEDANENSSHTLHGRLTL